MSNQESSFKITGGRLEGPAGSWSLRTVSGIHKVEGGKLSLKKYAVFLAGITAAGGAVTMGAAAVFILGGGSIAYYVHRTMNVMIVVGGKEIEILSVVYFSGLWNEENANNQCDKLIAMVSPHLK